MRNAAAERCVGDVLSRHFAHAGNPELRPRARKKTRAPYTGFPGISRTGAIPNSARVRAKRRAHPTRLFALRHGLCQMLEAGLIELDFAIDLWEQQHAWEVQHRHEEDERSA